jgi:hypothetical protein
MNNDDELATLCGDGWIDHDSSLIMGQEKQTAKMDVSHVGSKRFRYYDVLVWREIGI